MSSYIHVDGTDVQAAATSYAIHAFPDIRGEKPGAAVVQKDDKHFFGSVGLPRFFGSAKQTVIYRDFLSGAIGGQQRPVQGQVIQGGDDFFDPYQGNMRFRKGGG